MSTPPSSDRQDALHLLGLNAFAVAQPLFELLGRYATFIVAHAASAGDIVLFALVLCIVPPATLALIEFAVGLVSRRARRAVHLVFVALLVALVVLPPLHRAVDLPAPLAFAAALAVGALAAAACRRTAVARTFLTALSPAVLVFPLLFLFYSPAAALVRPEQRASAAPVEVRDPAPVVLIVFDEFSLLAMLDRTGAIDAVRYPNFAALAQTATWYRNATTVADFTPLAVPAILTGRLPDHNGLPNASDHPLNLFTLLGGAYEMRLSESVTDLCPSDVCVRDVSGKPAPSALPALLADSGLILLHALAPAGLRESLPDIQRQWTFQFEKRRFKRVLGAVGGDRGERFERFVDSIQPSERPTLSFLHILLPHYPYEYLPSGRIYDPPPPLFGRPPIDWGKLSEQLDVDSYSPENREGAYITQIRYLNQLAFVDWLLGDLLAHLRRVERFDETLLVITADHGVSLRAGQSSRFANERNLAEIMAVPLFIKRPHQRVGRVDDRNIETIDILPTIADLLGVALPWPVDGHSLEDDGFAPRSEKVLYTPLGLTNQLDLKRLVGPAERPENPAGLRHLIDSFGAGVPLPDQARSDARRRLLGQPVDAMPRAVAPAAFTVVLDQPERFATVEPQSRFIPAFVRGTVQPGSVDAPVPPSGTALAIAVNGVIRAVTEVLPDGSPTPAFGALVPESAWRPGANLVEVFAVVRDGATFALAVPGSDSP